MSGGMACFCYTVMKALGVVKQLLNWAEFFELELTKHKLKTRNVKKEISFIAQTSIITLAKEALT